MRIEMITIDDVKDKTHLKFKAAKVDLWGIKKRAIQTGPVWSHQLSTSGRWLFAVPVRIGSYYACSVHSNNANEWEIDND